jgi:hypothetical protein
MPPKMLNSAITFSGGRLTRARKNRAIRPPTPKRRPATSHPVSMPLPPARETRMKPVQMQIVAATAIHPEREEEGFAVKCGARAQASVRYCPPWNISGGFSWRLKFSTWPTRMMWSPPG